MSTILLMNGPNLGALGQREPATYGTSSLKEIESQVEQCLKQSGHQLIAIQDDGERELIMAIHKLRDSVAGAIINPGALMIAGWGLRDALAAVPFPWIELHISNIFAREAFRHTSILAPLASGFICGLGPSGYLAAAGAIVQVIARQRA